MTRIAVTREEEHVRCCDKPELVEDCCGCDGPDGESLMSTEWELQDDLSGMYSHVLAGILKFAWGCEKYGDEGVSQLKLTSGPYQTYPTPYGQCTWWSRVMPPAQCCALGCPADGSPGGIASGGPIGVYQHCYKYAAVPPVEPIFYWHLDCACDDLWVGDSSEWGSLEDCQTYDTNCHCSNDNGAYAGSDPEDNSECEYLRSYYQSLGFDCAPCEWQQVTDGYPGTPAFVQHSAGLSGTGCACNRVYLHLNPTSVYDGLAKDMIGSVGGSVAALPEFDCDGCNTYHLIQYHATMIDGSPAPNYPCCLGCGHICNGADLPCMDCGCGDGPNYFACYGYPATLTICPAGKRADLPTGSASNACDVLCCAEDGEVLEEDFTALSTSDTAMSPAVPENSIYWEVQGTITSGYLIRDEADGLYKDKGEIFPFTITVNKEEQTLNGKKIDMYSDGIFWGQTRLGERGWTIIVMA